MSIQKYMIILLIGVAHGSPTAQPTSFPVTRGAPGALCNERSPCLMEDGFCRAPFQRINGTVYGRCCNRMVGDGCSACSDSGACIKCQNSKFKLVRGECSFKKT